jgi:hypothetical protein
VNKANIEPALLHLNETEFKSVDSLAALLTYFKEFPVNRTMLNLSKHINVPSITINGSEDPFFCRGASMLPHITDRVNPLQAPDCSSDKALANFERPFFGANAVVRAQVVPNAGHGVTIERTAPKFYRAATRFLDQYVGS